MEPVTQSPVESSAPAEAPAPSLVQIAVERHQTLHRMLDAGQPSLSPDDVHDLRVAVRRLTEVVRLFEPLMDKPAARATADALKSLRKSAGELRDLDVMTELLADGKLPKPLRKIADELTIGFAGRRSDLLAQVGQARQLPSVTGTMVYLARLFEGCATRDPAETLARTLYRLIRKRRKQLRAAFGAAARKQTAAALHEARIAGKKLRYLLELAGESHLADIGEELKLLKEIQKLLGDHHDTHVLVETLHQHLADAGAHPPTGAWQRFHDRLERDQAKRAGAFFVQTYLWNNRSPSRDS